MEKTLKIAFMFLMLSLTIIAAFSVVPVSVDAESSPVERFERASAKPKEKVAVKGKEKAAAKGKEKPGGIIKLTTDETHSASGKPCVETLGKCTTNDECCGDICKRKMCRAKDW